MLILIFEDKYLLIPSWRSESSQKHRKTVSMVISKTVRKQCDTKNAKTAQTTIGAEG